MIYIILAVTVNDRLKFQDHVNYVIRNTSQCYFALRILKHHGMSNVCLQNIFKATVIPKMLYAIPSFWGFLTQGQKNQLQSVLNRAIKLNYYSISDPTVENLVSNQESKLYHKILNNADQPLHYLLPNKKICVYNLRKQQTFALPNKDERQFVNRLIFRNL